MIGASGVGRSFTLRSAGALTESSSRPSSLCIGWREGDTSGCRAALEPGCGSVNENKLNVNKD